MLTSAIAARYASALVDVVTAPASNIDPRDVGAQLRSFDNLVAASPELRNALLSPGVSGARKRAVASRVTESLGFSRAVRNFLFVLLDRRRIGELSEIVEAFEALLDERLGFARAEIVSAQELNEDQRTMLVSELERVAGKKIRARFQVDHSLIGGALARIGSTVYDGSVRAQLTNLERRLAAE